LRWPHSGTRAAISAEIIRCLYAAYLPTVQRAGQGATVPAGPDRGRRRPGDRLPVRPRRPLLPADSIADPPPQFARNIVQGKSYDLADPAVAGYFADILQLTLGAMVELDFSQPWHRTGPVFGDPRLAPYRLGQQSFKAVVLDSYHRRCAISGTHIPPVLQAAHIRPVTRGGEHRLDNGLLLRSDVHTLFDRGYLGVDPQHRLLVSPRLRADFSNGDQFYAKGGW